VAAPLLLSVVPARANIILAVQSVQAGVGTTGNPLEVTLENTGAAVTVAAFNFTITTADTDITFTGADFSTTDPYIFVGDSFDVINGFPLNTLSPGQTMDGNDLRKTIGAGTTIGSGATLGLGRVLFVVSPTAAPGPAAVTLLTDSAHASLTDPNGNNIPIDTFSNGQILVGAVPEPATAFLLAAALAGVFVVKRRAA
jgi:hypothetical protein